MEKKTTEQLIDELARSVSRSFSELEKHIEQGFSAVHDRLDQIRFEVSGQDRRLSNLEDRVRLISRKIGLDATGVDAAGASR